MGDPSESIFWFRLGVVVYVVATMLAAVLSAGRYRERWAQRRMERESWRQMQAAARRRMCEPLPPNERHPYRNVVQHMPRDR